MTYSMCLVMTDVIDFLTTWWKLKNVLWILCGVLLLLPFFPWCLSFSAVWPLRRPLRAALQWIWFHSAVLRWRNDIFLFYSSPFSPQHNLINAWVSSSLENRLQPSLCLLQRKWLSATKQLHAVGQHFPNLYLRGVSLLPLLIMQIC